MEKETSTAESFDEKFLVAFLKNWLPPDDYEEVNEELRKAFYMRKAKRERKSLKDFSHIRYPRSSKCYLHSREKRELGLYKLKKYGHKYNDFQPLYHLWKEYMKEYLEIPVLEKLGWTASPHDHQQERVLLKLVKADYHGCRLQVTRSKCPSFVGVAGIVLMETKNTLQILSKDNIVRTIPKEHSVFTFELDGYTFTIYGDHFRIRPSERVVKKVKSKVTIDL